MLNSTVLLNQSINQSITQLVSDDGPYVSLKEMNRRSEWMKWWGE